MQCTASVTALLALCLSGCALFPFGGHPTGRPGGGASPIGDGLLDYRVAFHCHSYLSHDSDGSPERIAVAAREIGLNAVILTDHYEPGNIRAAPRGVVDGVLLIPGVELRGMGGSLLAFGLREDFDKRTDAAELSARFRAKGGVVAGGHIERIDTWSLPVDAVEIYNLHAEFTEKSWWSILWRFLFLPVDRFFEGSISQPTENLATWDRLLAEGKRLPPLVGCDAHENIRFFGPLGGTVGTYKEIFRLFSNHVLARELREDLIVDAILKGRVYSVFDYLGDASGFQMSYGRDADSVRAIVGERAAYDPEATLEIVVPLEAEIRLVVDGTVAAEVRGKRLAQRLPGPGVCRAEVLRGGRLWILPSPIFVE